jgi:hypothetical protein
MTRVLCLFAFILLGVITVYSSIQVWHAHASKNWPTTDGVVVAFYGRPDYRYSVDGRTYTNGDVSCNELFNGFATRDSVKYAVRYPLDGKVVVRYCPSKPSRAVLETEFDASAGLGLISMSGFMTAMFAVGFVFGGRSRVRLG